VLEDAEGLGLLVAREHAGQIDMLQRAQRSGNALNVSLQLAAGDTMHVVVYNTRSEGNSLRPDVCVGTSAEVATCRAAHGDSTASSEPHAADSGGCSVGHQTSGVASGVPVALLLLWRLRRRAH
jgi:uncharacterized protein (TIGR03382 family)